MEYCPQCRKELRDNHNFCTNCGKTVSQLQPTVKPIIGGILLLSAGIIGYIITIIVTIQETRSPLPNKLEYVIPFMIIAIIKMVGPTFGIMSGYYSLKRKNFRSIITTIPFLIITAFIDYFAIRITFDSIIIFILGIFSFIFISTSKNEFVNLPENDV